MNFRTATVSEIWDETPSLKGIRLSVGEEVLRDYEQPGQVIAIQIEGGKPQYVVVASSLGADGFELLVGPAVQDHLRPVVGQTVTFSGPSGPGFPLQEALGKDVLIFAMGSAVAAVRPLIEQLRDERSDYGRINVFFGARSAEEFPYQTLYDRWRRDRIDLLLTMSPERVQTTFANDPLAVDDAVAFVCGSSAMMEEVTETLGRFGLGPDRIFRNW